MLRVNWTPFRLIRPAPRTLETHRAPPVAAVFPESCAGGGFGWRWRASVRLRNVGRYEEQDRTDQGSGGSAQLTRRIR